MGELVLGGDVKGRMSILDDATPFGIRFPRELLPLLKQYNGKVTFFLQEHGHVTRLS